MKFLSDVAPLPAPAAPLVGAAATETAVLSACDTGRGSITGDGVVGLSRGFISAGVPTIVVSLWPVSDVATAALMGHYYGAMKSGTPKAGTLREAMLKTKAEFPEPVMWAPFVLYGLPDLADISR